MRLRNAVTGVLASTLLAGALALGWQTPALAHDKLVSSNPKDGVALDAAPSQIVLTYSEAVQTSFATVAVTGPGGSTISEGKPQIVDNKVTQALKSEVPTGTYQVSWRVVSSDGHPINGTFTYSIKVIVPTPTPTQTTTSPAPTPTSAEPSTPASTPAGTSDEGQDGGGGSPLPWVVVGALALIIVIVGGVVLARRGRQRAAGAGPGNGG